MSTDLTVRIQAEDGASKVFQAIGKSADGMARSAESAGQDAARGLQQVDKQAATTERSVGSLGKAFGPLKGAVAGLAGSALVGFLSDSARAAADAEAVMARLETAVGNTGESFADLEPAINAALDGAEQLAFDGEAAADALSTLTNFTGDASEALDLLGLTMDIARGRGVDLATAATAVGKAAEGNVGALTRMGVAVQEGATAQEALAAAQATFSGQAQTYADTTQGAFDKIAVSAGNLQEQIGGLLGPAATLIGILPGLSSGFSLVSGALGGLTGGAGASSVLTTVAGAAGGATGPLLALAPAIAAVGVAAGAAAIPVTAFVAAMYLTGDPNEKAAQTFGVLTDGIEKFGLAADDKGTEFLAFVRDYVGGTINLRDANGKLTGEQKAANEILPDLVGLNEELFVALVSQIDPNKTLIEQWETLEPIIAQTIGQQERWNRITLEYGIGLSDYSRALMQNQSAIDANRQAAYRAMIVHGELRTGIVGTRSEYDEYTQSTGLLTDAQQALVDTLNESLLPTLTEVPGAMQEIVHAGDDYLDIIDRMASGRVDGLGLADDLNDAQQALSGTLGAMEQIAALNDPIEQAVDVVDELMAPLGETGALEAWMQRSADAITNGGTALGLYGDTLTDVSQVQAEYEAVLGGQVQLTEANERAGRAVTEMLLAQVPLVGDQANALADYIEQLRAATPEEQQRAMYLMDSANAAKVAAAQATVYSASVGEIPTTVASDIILNAAQADPVLAGILEDMGYVEVGADGTITVTLPDSSQLALDKFEAMFGEGNVREANGLIYVTDADGNTLVYDQFNNLVDKTVTATVNVQVGGADSDAVLGALAGRGLSAEDFGLASETNVAVSLTADDSEFQRILSESRSAAQAWSQERYEAQLAADAAAAEQAAADAAAAGDVYADGTYDASLTATDNASVTIDTPQDAATTYATGTYDASITATDNASAVIATPQSAAQAYVAEYGADINARDLASAIISDVAAQLSGLDGDRATVYVDVVQSGTIPGLASGGMVLPDVPRAANGRVVMVGEAGPELAVLPYGTRVVPTGASRSRVNSMQQSGSAYGKYNSLGDAKRAYDDGKKTADEFYGGLLDANAQRMDEVKAALSEPFDTKEEALAALQEYEDLKRGRDQLKDAYRRARKAEKEEAKQAARETGTAIGDSATGAADDFRKASENIETDIADIGAAATDIEPDIADLQRQLEQLDGTFTANLNASGDLDVKTLEDAVKAAKQLDAEFEASLNANTTGGFGTIFGNDGNSGTVGEANSAAEIFDKTWTAMVDGMKANGFGSIFGAEGDTGIIDAATTSATDFDGTFKATADAEKTSGFGTVLGGDGKGGVVKDADSALGGFEGTYTAKAAASATVSGNTPNGYDIQKFVNDMLAAKGIQSKSIKLVMDANVTGGDPGGGDPPKDKPEKEPKPPKDDECSVASDCGSPTKFECKRGRCKRRPTGGIRGRSADGADISATSRVMPMSPDVTLAQVATTPASDLAAATANSLRGSAPINIYGSVTVMPPTADLAAAISNQLLSQGRA